MKKLAIVLFVVCTSCTTKSNIKKIENFLENYDPEKSSALTYYRAQDDCFDMYVTEYIDTCKRLEQNTFILNSKSLICSNENKNTNDLIDKVLFFTLQKQDPLVVEQGNWVLLCNKNNLSLYAM